MGDLAISGSITEKIAWARNVYGRVGEFLGRDHEIAKFLWNLQEAIKRSKTAMETAGVREICRICEEVEGGSCCGAGIENRYDGYLLLINLAMGVELPNERWDQRSCFFLSPEGCCLEARHVICINYLCRRVQDHVEPEKLARLRELEGEEINLVFHLHERIKKVLRESSGSLYASDENG